MRGTLRATFALVAILASGFGSNAFAAPVEPVTEEEESAVGSYLRLLKSGRIPPGRVGTVVGMVCQRGNASDLTYVFDTALSEKGYTGTVLLAALRGLETAARERKVRPKGDLGRISALLASTNDDATRLVVAKLAGLWRVETLAEPLGALSLDRTAKLELRRAALDSLVAIGGESAAKIAAALADKDRSPEDRFLGAAAMVGVDLERAAAFAADALASSPEGADPTRLVRAFLHASGGSDRLASALAGKNLSRAVARRALGAVVSSGRSDPALVESLAAAAGIEGMAAEISPEEAKRIEADVIARGNPARGEVIFRRSDLGCMACHAVSKAGGDIGPDLSAVGGSSPVEYLIQSILAPEQAVKEEYRVVNLVTADGGVVSGIVVDRSDDAIILKNGAGERQTIPADDVIDEDESGTLMPSGLTRFLARDEFVDLVAFLSRLGKDGEYAVRSTETVQRWSALRADDPRLAATPPDGEALKTIVFGADSSAWKRAYGRVAGALPLDEISEADSTLFLRAEVNVVIGGKVELRVDSSDGLAFWLDGEPIDASGEWSVELAEGKRSLVVRVLRSKRPSAELRVELVRAEDSAAQFTVVGGP